MKIKFEGLCPHCGKGIEIIRDLPPEVLAKLSSQPTELSTRPTDGATSGILSEETNSIGKILTKINWHRNDYKTAKSWLKSQFKVEGDDLWDMIANLTEEQKSQFTGHIKTMAEAS